MTIPELTVPEVTVFATIPKVTVQEVTVPEVTWHRMCCQSQAEDDVIRRIRSVRSGRRTHPPRPGPPRGGHHLLQLRHRGGHRSAELQESGQLDPHLRLQQLSDQLPHDHGER